MRAAPCGRAATRRSTFISWAQWLYYSLLHLLAFIVSHRLCISFVILPLLCGVEVQDNARKGTRMSLWGEIEARPEMNPAAQIRPALSGLPVSYFSLHHKPVGFVFPVSTMAPTWHETSISTPWNIKRALMNCLQVSNMHAYGRRERGLFSRRLWRIKGRHKCAQKPMRSGYKVLHFKNETTQWNVQIIILNPILPGLLYCVAHWHQSRSTMKCFATSSNCYFLVKPRHCVLVNTRKQPNPM